MPLFLCDGVCFVVDGFEVVEVEVGVFLCCRERFVSEQFLYASEVGAHFQQMSGEGVSDGMGADVPGQAAF